MPSLQKKDHFYGASTRCAIFSMEGGGVEGGKMRPFRPSPLLQQFAGLRSTRPVRSPVCSSFSRITLPLQMVAW